MKNPRPTVLRHTLRSGLQPEYSDYEYGDKKMTYLTTEYGDGKPLRKIRTEITDKY